MNDTKAINIKPKKKGCLVPILIIFALIGGMVLAISSAADIENGIFENVSIEESAKAREILKECGIENIKSVTHDELLDYDGLIGYRVSTELDKIGDVCVYFDNEKLRQVRFLGQYLYRNQQVEAVAQDFYVTTDEATSYQINCQKAIKELLKSPATAKFPNITEWGLKKEDGVVTVQSYVDAQNSFGAMIRSYFQFKIKDNTVTSLMFDGTEYIK